MTTDLTFINVVGNVHVDGCVSEMGIFMIDGRIASIVIVVEIELFSTKNYFEE